MDPIPLHKLAEYGLVGAILAVVATGIGGIGWGAYRIVGWVGQEVVIPWRNRGLAHFDKVETAIDRLTLSVDKQTALLDSIESAQIASACRLPPENHQGGAPRPNPHLRPQP